MARNTLGAGTVRRLFRRLLNSFQHKRLDAEIEEELDFHRRKSVGRFGNVTAIRELAREASTVAWLETVAQDFRIAVRLMRRAPSVTAIALLSTALSVGTTAVVFTAVKAVLLTPLPYRHPSELIQLGVKFNGAQPSHIDFVFWNDTQEIIRRTKTLESIGVYSNAVFDLGGGRYPPEALYGLRVTASLFPTLGVTPMLGRNILPEEDAFGRPNELILSYGLWMRRFHGDRNIVGKTTTINGHDCLVIGVMRPEFNFPLRRAAAHMPQPYVEFWAPMKAGRLRWDIQGAVGAVGRLRPGVSIVEARQEMTAIGAALTHEFPATNRDRTLSAGLIWDRTVRTVSPALWLLMGAATIFLLIGCANIANLLLARGLARQREMAVRMAIGAGRVRIIRQLLTESSVLAVTGGLAGYALTAVAWRILPAFAPVSIPRLATAQADETIFIFAVVISLVNGLLFGLAPALRSSSTRNGSDLCDLGTRGAASVRRDRTRALLLVGEVGVTVALVLIGGQLVGSLLKLMSADPGFQADRIAAAVVLPEPERYQAQEQRGSVYKRFLDAVRAIPGVTSAGIVDALPFSGENHAGFVSANGIEATDTKNQSVAEVNVVGGDYLQTLGVRLIAGRWFRNEDARERSDTVIINDAAARHLWPKKNAIGNKLCVNCSPENPRNWKRVIGIVSSVRHADLGAAPGLNVYLSANAFQSAAFLVARTDRPVGAISKAIPQAIAAVDPQQTVLLSTSMQSLLADSIADRRFVAGLLGTTGVLALLMALAGVYGVASYTASRRTQEIGVRMAVGATPGSVHAMLFRQGFAGVIAGLAIGFCSALILMRLLRGMVAGLETQSLALIWIAGCLVLCTAALACWIPAHRAVSSDPMAALRQD